MNTVYIHILSAIERGEKLLAVLIDPDKFSVEKVPDFILKVEASIATHIFVGGSTVEDERTGILVETVKAYAKLPVVLFPGDVTQITNKADALLFLSLISGRNSEYLIGKHVASVSKLRGASLEVIPTGYILVENGKETAVQRVTHTKPMSRVGLQQIVDTARAGEFLGMKLMYLEAGSGAIHPITPEIIDAVKQELDIPLIVGGGIRTKKQIEDAYQAGADMVVIGTALEKDDSLFIDLKQ